MHVDFQLKEWLPAPAALIRFVQKLKCTMEPEVERRKTHRLPTTLLAPAIELDEFFQPVGREFLGIVRNVSIHGLSLLHTDFVDAKYLAVQLHSPTGEAIQAVVKVLRCDPVGTMHAIAGKFIHREMISLGG